MKKPSLIKYTDQELKDARSAGFKKKKPKKPKGKVTDQKLSAFISKMNNWTKELKEKAKIGKSLRENKSFLSGI